MARPRPLTVSSTFVRSAESFGTALFAPPIFAGEHAAAKRRPCYDTEPQSPGRWKQIEFRTAMDQTVLELPVPRTIC